MPVFVSDHPVLKQKLTVLRNKKTDGKTFRDVLREITVFLGYEATRDLELKEVNVSTPVASDCLGHKLKSRVALIPVLRSGLGMVQPMVDLIPYAQIFHLGLYRHKHSLVPVLYYERFPDKCTADVSLVLEPMIASGGSLCATIEILKSKYGCKKIKVISVLACRKGLDVLEEKPPAVNIHCCAIDEVYNENGVVVPGLGDIGDRQFRTVVGRAHWEDDDDAASPKQKKQRTE